MRAMLAARRSIAAEDQTMTDGRRFNEDSSRRFTRRPDGVIVDHERGLEWFALARTRNWDELMLEPFTPVPGEGWRVPKCAELQTDFRQQL